MKEQPELMSLLMCRGITEHPRQKGDPPSITYHNVFDDVGVGPQKVYAVATFRGGEGKHSATFIITEDATGLDAQVTVPFDIQTAIMTYRVYGAVSIGFKAGVYHLDVYLDGELASELSRATEHG